MLTLFDFYKMLESHDWTYQYSDDHRYWKKGSDEARQIDHVLEMQGSDKNEYRELYNAYADYIWREGPKPTCPNKGE